MKNVLLYPAAALALLASGTVSAQLQTLTDDINVTAEVQAACTSITATDVDFGPAPAADAQDDATSTVTVTCSPGTSYTVEMDDGMTAVGGIRRVTTGAGDFMDYYIYQPGGFTTAWGQGTDALADTAGATPTDYVANFRLERVATAAPGTYTDLVTVTLSY